MVLKCRKKRIVVEAVLYEGYNFDEVLKFTRCSETRAVVYDHKRNGIIIKTLEGDMLCAVGDYVIKGVKGEFYPCKPDIFAETYEIMEEVFVDVKG